jgi:hypothetical protein
MLQGQRRVEWGLEEVVEMLGVMIGPSKPWQAIMAMLPLDVAA